MCVYPADAPHQSYSLQVTSIIRSDGAEICFCLGAGWAQITNSSKRRRAETYLTRVKAALSSIPPEVVSDAEAALSDRWALRRRWRSEPAESDFGSLGEWLEFASTEEGSGASISQYLSPEELEALGDGFGSSVLDLAGRVAPIIDAVTSYGETEEVVAVGEPEYTQFEKKLHETASPIYEEGRTGYAWQPVDELLAAELDLDGVTRCKRAGGSGRAANVLTESNDKDIALYLIFIGPDYNREAFIDVAIDRTQRFPNVETVAIADRTGTYWRVRSIVERAGIGGAKKIRSSFPAVTDDDIVLVDSDLTDEEEIRSPQPPAVPAVDPDIFDSAMLDDEAELDELEGLIEDFREFAEENGVIVDATMAADYLAATLSSQLLFFAGPSGTGKSVSARLLQRFFAQGARSQTLEARRQWLSPDDLVGYYSVLADQFATTPDTGKLVEAHEASINPVISGKEIEGPPILLVEEINLSPPEGYLAPVIHGLSGVSTPRLLWDLHSRTAGAVDQSSVIKLPETLRLGPYPRVLGTINVDSTAHAPARKVASRACVLLLEPKVLSENELKLLGEAVAVTEPESGAPGPLSWATPLQRSAPWKATKC